MCTLGYILLLVSEVYGVIVSDDAQRYLTCTTLTNGTHPGDLAKWYWKLLFSLLYSLGKS